VFAAIFAFNAYAIEKLTPQIYRQTVKPLPVVVKKPVSGPVSSEKRGSGPSPVKKPVLNESAFEKNLQACINKLDIYSKAAAALTGSGCNRFGEEKYKSALKAKGDFLSCAPLLKIDTAVATRQAADQAVVDFAEQCVCRKRIDNMDVNLNVLEKIRSEGCMGPTPVYALQQATSSRDINVDEWSRMCRGVVSAGMDNSFWSKLEHGESLEARIAPLCAVVDNCRKAVDQWGNAVKAVKEKVDNKCSGLLYATIDDAKNRKDVARQTCKGPTWNALVSKDEENYRDKMLTAAVLQCTTTDAILNHRCPFSLEAHVVIDKQTGTYHKKRDVLARLHYCSEEEDMPWCRKYAGFTATVDSENWLVSADKTVQVTVDACVDPSEWRKCKAISSSTGQCTEFYTKCKAYSKTTPGKCVDYE